MEWTSVVTAELPAGVEAGTLLGAGAHVAAGLAGDGAIAVARPGGRVEVRAARDGVPRLSGDGVIVGRLHELAGNVDREAGDHAVRGSLRIGGHVAPGRELSATGPIRVGGDIDRAQVRAGGELQIEGRAGGASLVGGSLAALRGRLHEPLREVARDIDALLVLADQLLGAAAGRACVTTDRVIRALCAERFATLEPRLARAGTVLVPARRSWPGLCAGLAAELAAANRAVTAPHEVGDPLGLLAAAAGFLAAAIPAQRPAAGIGIRVSAAHGCWIETAGTLRLTGAGATDCDITVGGDLIAMGAGGAICGGRARVGGRVRVRELAARHGSRLRLVIEDTSPSDDVLRAEVVNAGVEVVVGGRAVRFDRRCSDVRIGVSGGRPVLAAA